MSCCHYYEFADGYEQAFAVDVSALTFGPGVLAELGGHVRGLGLQRVAVMTDRWLRSTSHLSVALASLQRAGVHIEVYDEIRVEPTDKSFTDAATFATEGHFDGFVSIGGGSVIDTCKAANLYATYPADFLAYVNPPIGEGCAVPGALRPHIACPTTCGTGSECTGIAVFDLLELRAKTGIASRRLRPTLALIDPSVTASLPGPVVASSGFDVLSHALESYTAVPYTQRPRPSDAGQRPMSQGANPWSDVGCEQALRLVGRYLQRAVEDAADAEARGQMMYAATLAGIAFGNSGVHIPHGMSYSVAGLVREFRPEGYPQQEPMVPHGMSVIVNAPAAFQFSAHACPQRHLRGAELLGAESEGIDPADAGSFLSQHLVGMMRAANMPNGIGGVGYDDADIGALAEGAFLQQRLLKNAPCAIDQKSLAGIYHDAIRYW